jgi:hypothetical protein
MNSIYRVLLFGGLFIFPSKSVLSKTILSDVFVYKISNEVLSLNDLKRNRTLLETLKCLYPESILAIQFKDILKIDPDTLSSDQIDMAQVENKLKASFERFMLLTKLNQYVDSHNIVVKEGLSKAFYVATRKECNKIKIFKTENTFSDEFEAMISTEIFLRKRFLNEKNSSVKQEYGKAVKAIEILLLSISSQISSEIYWTK